jgi:hypothetical protein
MQHESLELTRKELGLCHERAALLRELVAVHQELMAALGNQRPS